MTITCKNPDCGKSSPMNHEKPFLFCPFCSCYYPIFGVSPIAIANEETEKLNAQTRASDWYFKWTMIAALSPLTIMIPVISYGTLTTVGLTPVFYIPYLLVVVITLGLQKNKRLTSGKFNTQSV